MCDCSPYDREDGINAIIELQRAAGIEESRDKATRAWDRMTERDRAQTTWVHRHMLGGFKERKPG